MWIPYGMRYKKWKHSFTRAAADALTLMTIRFIQRYYLVLRVLYLGTCLWGIEGKEHQDHATQRVNYVLLIIDSYFTNTNTLGVNHIYRWRPFESLNVVRRIYMIRAP